MPLSSIPPRSQNPLRLPSAEELTSLKRLSIEVRRLVLRSVHHARAGHVGGPLSAAEILVSLYFHVLRLDPARPKWEDRDRFIISKGHSCIALYATMALRGYFPVAELQTFDALNSRLQAHPDMTLLPGLDMSTGSLGQGLAPGIGMALAARFWKKDFRVYVLIGDGDAQEGEIWESSFVAGRYRLDNLTAILDWNGLQQYGWATPQGYSSPARLPAVEDPRAKWESFGWHVLEIDGHEPAQIIEACAQARQVKGKPTMIVARTVKGKGVSFMENNFAWHSKPVTDEDLARALAELDQAEGKL
jgi:transketolase